MAKKKSGLGKAIKFAAGLVVAGFALLNAYKAAKRAYRAVKGVSSK